MKESEHKIHKFLGGLKDWEDGTGSGVARLEVKAFCGEMERLNVDLKLVTVLELGSGKNIFADQLKKSGIKVVSVDIRPRGVEASNQVVARVERLPFVDGSFQIVRSSGLFDESVYVQNQSEMLREIARVLKPGGYYVSSAETIAIQIPAVFSNVESTFSSFTIFRNHE
jgi:ubiquinone/menaquinone biosynthesis C-methylase UbiE